MALLGMRKFCVGLFEALHTCLPRGSIETVVHLQRAAVRADRRQLSTLALVDAS